MTTDVSVNTTLAYDVADSNITTNHSQATTPPVTMEAIQILLGSMGVIGNTFVVIVIFKFTNMRKQAANIFIINQSLVDIVASTGLIITLSVKLQYFYLTGIVGDFLCRLLLSNKLIFGTMMSSTYNLIALNLERYLKVVHAVAYKRSFRGWKVNLVLALVWLVGPAFVFSSGMPTSIIRDGKCLQNYQWPSQTAKTMFGYLNITTQFFIPMLVFFYTYIRMFREIRLRAKLIMPSLGVVDGRELKALTPVEKNVVKTLFIVTICFVVCWSPDQIYFFFYNVGYPLNFDDPAQDFAVLMITTNLCINPLIYITNYKQFRRGVQKLLQCKAVTESEFDSSSNQSSRRE